MKNVFEEIENSGSVDKPKSAVEAASYISRSVLEIERTGEKTCPKYHEDLVHSEILLTAQALGSMQIVRPYGTQSRKMKSIARHSLREVSGQVFLTNGLMGRQRRSCVILSRKLLVTRACVRTS